MPNNESHEINDEATQSEFKELALLPARYNMTFIETLIRDPLWVFVFWEINTNKKNILKYTEDFEGYCLRIIPLKDKNVKPVYYDPSFTVNVGENDSAWYLGFPPEHARCNMVELCAIIEDNISVIAVSRPFVLPHLIEPKFETVSAVPLQNSDIQAIYRNPLAQLSGAGQFMITHSIDRLPRIHTNLSLNGESSCS